MSFHLNPLKKPVDKDTSIMWGTYRSIVNHAVLGVTKGHEKILRTEWSRLAEQILKVIL